MRGFTEDEVLPFARFAREHPYEVRFIEFMPLDADHAWSPDAVLTGEEIRAADPRRLPARARAARAAARRPACTASPTAAGGSASSTRSREPFCGDCNRIRLTADGRLRTCLFSLHETDLRAPLRAGASDDDARAHRPRRRLAQGAQAPRRRPGLRAARAHDERDRRLAPATTSSSTLERSSSSPGVGPADQRPARSRSRRPAPRARRASRRVPRRPRGRRRRSR